MSTLNLTTIEQRLLAVATSYQRQLALAGKPGYDPVLTDQLKKDLDWLEEQKQRFLENLDPTGDN
jgi:hypothetical protein